MLARRSLGAGLPRVWRDEFDRLFTDMFSAGNWPAWVSTGGGYPAINLWEGGDAMLVEAELPGLTEKDVEVSVVGNELTIRGRRTEQPIAGVTHHRRERSCGEFARVLRLPVDVEADQVQATLHDGVLTIRLPKIAAVKPRKVQVTGGR